MVGLGALGGMGAGALGAMNPMSALGGGMTGGGSSATSGDQGFDSNATFGGLNYGGTGVNPWLIAGLAGLALVYMLKK
ncbi:hypothetical protein [Pseudoalteromonas sp. 68 DY56-GL68]|uniref:hypothetical protein n=1 Tax=Pseudoalteromonas sp. 68 DY56-GL68 TaxID=2974919 RepID=UPI00352B224B|tara:strand:+ start:56 stop:289 length:234 start_codon:yes stop_codon:yes gene_type:complete